MIILLLLLAHLVADFWLQTDTMVKYELKGFINHMLYHLITTGVALVIISLYRDQLTSIFSSLLFPLLFIVGTHLLIDILKVRLLNLIKITNSNSLFGLWFFLVSQMLHIMMLFISCILFFDFKPIAMINDLSYALSNNNGLNSFGIFNTSVFIIILFILTTSVSGHIVRLLVGSLPSEIANYEGEFTLNKVTGSNSNNYSQHKSNFTEQYHYLTYSSSLPSRGRIIGYVERLLVVTLTIVGAYSSIAFIVAAKSIARFKQLDDRNWAEYFLLGTLTSIFLGLMIGILANKIFM